MPAVIPPDSVIAAFTAPVTRHTRRVEIYEEDGVTRWAKDTVVRLKDGSVTVDYDRAERRAIDLVLDNSDAVLLTQAGEFWYDKIIKVFRGVRIPGVVDPWEVQIGEFMIDRITEKNFPHEVSITGRDYTKKCLNAKFVYATQFSTGQALETLIATIASNAGIVKRSLPTTGVTVNSAFFFERGVTRWDAMKQIANSYNYDIFFDPYGYLTIKQYSDPGTTSPSLYLKTGSGGTMVSYEKSTSDSRLYNHIIVTGESSDSSVPPVYGESMNTTVGSPTSIAEIGDRLFEYTSAFIYTTPQAQAVADRFLAIHSLEQFELSFDSLMLPWVEVGDIIDFNDGDISSTDPTRFLFSSVTLPLSLSPMSGVGKRVTIVS